MVDIDQQMRMAILIWVIGIPIILTFLSVLHGYTTPCPEFKDEKMYFVIVISSICWPVTVPVVLTVDILCLFVYLLSELGKKISGR